MDDVVMKLVFQWRLMKAKIINRPTDHQWSLLVIQELWSRQVEGLKCLEGDLLSTTVIYYQN